MASVARNAPCPCGSGKRFKACHGAFDPADAGPPAKGPPPWLGQAMRDALRAQRGGAGDEAASLYRRVLEADPGNFDATHMLGLVEYERGHYDTALGLIRHAIELRSDLGAPRQHLRMLETMPRVETEVCRQVLPRLAPRLDLGANIDGLAGVANVNVVIGDAPGEEERHVLARLAAACVAPWTIIWDEVAAGEIVGERRTRKLSRDEHPRGGALVVVGTARSFAPWIADVQAARVLLIVTRDEPCATIDRIDELYAAGYRRPGLLCATGALGDRLGLDAGTCLRKGAACADA